MSVKEFLDAGVHYGHRTSRWHPSMAPYIYGKRKGIHIIDLRQTVRGIAKARRFLNQLASQGQPILFVGTKRQAAGVVREEVGGRGLPFVAERWLGGTLTNFQTVRKSLGRLEVLENTEKSAQFAAYKKKMVAIHMREKRKILRNLEGVRELTQLPAALVVVDPKRDKIAVNEAVKLGIAVIALIDTDTNPKNMSICIPCNDDSIRSVQVVLGYLVEAVVEGGNMAGAVATDKASGTPGQRPEPRPAPAPAPAAEPPPAAPGGAGPTAAS
ncbi:MAG TPA: 30S ribosomal protein S2 [Planctomycetota bacterium]|nr:30S ribosomal protein S2 [Planctomycetota bacterium]